MKLRKRNPISEEELKRIKIELSINNNFKQIKRALQDVCGHYELSRFFPETGELRQLIHSHLDSKDTLVRRWSLKSLGLIGSPDDTHRIVNRIRLESDYEAVTWGTAALFATKHDKTLQEISKEAGFENDKSIRLAAQLYAPEKWSQDNLADTRVSLNDDIITLKWAIFLIGYNKAPVHLFDPKYSNDIFLGNLNQHDSPEVSEYSVWALWERPDFDAKHLSIPREKILKYPENIRKWLYRLITKPTPTISLTPEEVHDYYLNDTSPARDGLARGIVDANNGQFDNNIICWSGTETDPVIRLILLSGMAKRGDFNEVMQEIVQNEFQKSPQNSAFRQTLLAAAAGTSLYTTLKRIIYQENGQQVGQFNFNGPVTIIGSNQNMTHGNTISVGGNLQAQNLIAGDMIDSVNNAKQKISKTQGYDRDVLEKLFVFLSENSNNLKGKENVYKAISSAEIVPTKENKSRILESLKSLGDLTNITGSFTDIIELISDWAA